MLIKSQELILVKTPSIFLIFWFFNIFKTDYNIEDLQQNYNIDKINKFNSMFKHLRNEYLLKDINIPELMEKDMSIYNKKQILEKSKS